MLADCLHLYSKHLLLLIHVVILLFPLATYSVEEDYNNFLHNSHTGTSHIAMSEIIDGVWLLSYTWLQIFTLISNFSLM